MRCYNCDKLQDRIDELEEQAQALELHLKEVCKPEPDGIGSFVADEFTSKEVLNARQALEAYEAWKGKS